jgi:hypothetical protein
MQFGVALHRLRRSTRQPSSGEESTMSDQVDRSELPIPDPMFTGTIHRTLEGSVPDWNIVTSVEPPQGAPNVLLVLIDDAGSATPAPSAAPSRPQTSPAQPRAACAITGST